MATDVIMPQMGESIAEGTITRWLVQVGDSVERDQPLFEISTDKVDAEIPSPADGVLLAVQFEEGATVPVNEIVATLGAAGEKPPEVAAVSESTDAHGQAVVEPAAAPAPHREADSTAEIASEAERVRTVSSPVVRKMAAEQGIDLTQVQGSGIHGRVTKRDLEAFLAGGPAAVAGSKVVAPPVAAVATDPGAVSPQPREPSGFSVPAYTPGEVVQITPMSKIRAITSAHMTYSKATSAHVTTVFHMDLTRIARVRRRAKAGFAKTHGTKLTYMPFVFQAVASALKANPIVNSSVDGSNIVYKKDINIGMAVALDWGLLVPVIRSADQLNLVGLAKTANDLADRARSKKLKPEEVQGGTFTITNPGVFGSLFGTPIINQPQVAILGLGMIEKRPVVVTDAEGVDSIAIRDMAYFAITYDHRVVDGADADHFMIAVKKTLAEDSWNELDPFV